MFDFFIGAWKALTDSWVHICGMLLLCIIVALVAQSILLAVLFFVVYFMILGWIVYDPDEADDAAQ